MHSIISTVAPRRLLALGLLAFSVSLPSTRAAVPANAELHDSHFHLTNYIQEGTDIREFLMIMGDRVGRVALFGIPLQQMWAYENSGDYAPTYYLQTDEPLYYYSFTDAFIAQAYLSLKPADRERFDPMITGFNPADMYGVDHIRRVLLTYPGVFSGIGEFTIHKEFVSSKVAGDIASLTDPALDRILDFAAEAGLVVILHNDIDMPFSAENAEPVYLTQMKDLLRRHPDATIIWAHTGLGRVVRPARTDASAPPAERSPRHIDILGAMLEDPGLKHVHFDISWTEMAKYVISSPEATALTAELLNRFPDRFLFGTDEVAPKDQAGYLRIDDMYAPLWAKLTPDASLKVRKQNYERLFDAARKKVRAWEASNRP
jgi:hypothetical protein